MDKHGKPCCKQTNPCATNANGMQAKKNTHTSHYPMQSKPLNIKEKQYMQQINTCVPTSCDIDFEIKSGEI